MSKGANGFLKKLGLIFRKRDHGADRPGIQAGPQDKDNVNGNDPVTASSLRRRFRLFCSRSHNINLTFTSEEDMQVTPSVLSTPISPTKPMASRRRLLRAVLGGVSDGHLDRRPSAAPAKAMNSSLLDTLTADLDLAPFFSERVASSRGAAQVATAAGEPPPLAAASLVHGVLSGRQDGETQRRNAAQSHPQSSGVCFDSFENIAAALLPAVPNTPLAPQLLAVSPAAPTAMQRETWTLQDYRISRRLYRGATSSVYLATCLPSRQRVALKVYMLDRVPVNAMHMLAREIAIHIALDHPHIIKLYGAFQEEARLVLVQEYAARGDLFSLLRRAGGSRMCEDQVQELVMAPFLDTLAYLHSRGICHRDIKPENIFLDRDWQLKIGDFGISINLAEERAVTRAGTLDYMAPEVNRCPMKMLPDENKDNPHLAYTTAVDVWAAGVLAYELLVGFPPFATSHAAAAAAAASGAAPARAPPPQPQPQPQPPPGVLGRYAAAAAAALGVGSSRRGSSGSSSTAASQWRTPPAIVFPASVSAHARDFILHALASQPDMRSTARELQAHPWMRRASAQLQIQRQKQQKQQQKQQKQPHPHALAEVPAPAPALQ